MPTYALWHNPNCSKSRAALEILREHGIEPDIRDYRAQPPDAAELRAVLRSLDLPARALLRGSDADAVSLGLDDAALDDDALVAAMVAHPHLIERPIFLADARAIVGRPPERVLELLHVPSVGSAAL